jgi:hypothetical protein
MNRVSTLGGSVSLVFSDYVINAYVVSVSSVYYAAGSSVESASISNGVIKEIHSCNPTCANTIRVYNSNVYYVNLHWSTYPSIQRVSINGGTAKVIYKGSFAAPGERPNGLVISSGYIY